MARRDPTTPFDPVEEPPSDWKFESRGSGRTQRSRPGPGLRAEADITRRLPAESVENESKADVFENAEVANSRRTRVCIMYRVVV